LIVASNRVADLTSVTQAGGLAVALYDALTEASGLWFGWDGNIVADSAPQGLNLERQQRITVATQPLSQWEYDNYYLGYANNVLWPVFHYRLDLAQFDADALNAYRAVNERFARSLAALIEEDDLVWIHDYHLIPLAEELRKLGIRNRIGFFLHIPFPPPEMVSAVPEHLWLVKCLLSYDLVGFQTHQDVDNFGRYVEQALSMDGMDLTAQRRPMQARCFPIGIDPASFADMARSPEADERIVRLTRGSIHNHVIGVDRLDYSKGLPDRFRAYRAFLERYPEQHKNIVLMQIAPPTRETLTAYADIRAELEQLSGSINGEFGDFDWTPVRYIHRAVPRDTLAALLRGSKVGLVTPLRDGMNLVAKEYVAAQDEDDPGVLVLSQFAGAAADLHEALIVNPYDPEQVAAAMHLAVNMDVEERRERHAALLERVRKRDVNAWRHSFLACLRRGNGTEPAET
jgi:trehalose 6-phosphate synthase